MQFNTIVISGVCGLTIFPSDSTLFFNVQIQKERPVASLADVREVGDEASAPGFGTGRAGLAVQHAAKVFCERRCLSPQGRPTSEKLRGNRGAGIIFRRQCELRGVNCRSSQTPAQSLRLGSSTAAKPAPPCLASQAPAKNPPRRLLLRTELFSSRGRLAKPSFSTQQGESQGWGCGAHPPQTPRHHPPQLCPALW